MVKAGFLYLLNSPFDDVATRKERKFDTPEEELHTLFLQ